MARAEILRGYVGCGLFFALIAGSLGSSDAECSIAFVFGATYGALWINH